MTDTSRLRQPHKKSRKGCRECKKRHVKCDERYPACGGCAVTDRRCSFLDLQPVHLPSARRTTSPASSSSCGRLTPSAESAADAVDGAAACLQPDPQPTPCFDVRHLVLLHHLETEFVKASGPVSWLGSAAAASCAEAVFQSAVSAPYLMDELLAFSALHLSTLQSDIAGKAEYLRQAAELQTRGLALFNSVKPQVRNENCIAMLAFASFIGMHSLFDAVNSCPDSIDLDKITNYLKLHRGVGAITDQSWHVLRHSEIRHIIDSIEAGSELYHQQFGDTENECDQLMSLVHESSDKLGPRSYKACREAVEALHWVFGVRRTVSQVYSTQIILAWPVRISADFVELLEQRQPIALIILAYWAVLLHADRDFWAFGHAGRNLINCLLAYLGSYWNQWLHLPRRVLKHEGR